MFNGWSWTQSRGRGDAELTVPRHQRRPQRTDARHESETLEESQETIMRRAKTLPLNKRWYCCETTVIYQVLQSSSQ